MKHVRSLVFSALFGLAAVSGMVSTTAHADEYADVTALLRAGKLPEALGKADQFLATQPRDPQMRFIKGVIQRDSGKTSDAIATFTKLTEDYPELPEPYNNLAVLYAGQSQFDKARAALEMAIRTNPSYATAHENLGDIYAKLASQAYNKALQLDNTTQPAVAPKLALIREIFSSPSKAPRPAAPTVPPPPAPAPVPSTPVTTTPKPVPPPTPAPQEPPAPAVVAGKPTQSATTAPAAITPTAPAAQPPAKAVDGAEDQVEAAVARWAKAWSSRDVKGYLAAYGKAFDPPGNMSRKDWEEEREQRISSKATITVKVDRLKVSVDGNSATARFRQDYKAGSLAVASNKVLEFSKSGDRWLIVKEVVGN
jgi:tetratricopeptide (TPR) repeat protein